MQAHKVGFESIGCYPPLKCISVDVRDASALVAGGVALGASINAVTFHRSGGDPMICSGVQCMPHMLKYAGMQWDQEAETDNGSLAPLHHRIQRTD
jgi:hypothetical protein